MDNNRKEVVARAVLHDIEAPNKNSRHYDKKAFEKFDYNQIEKKSTIDLIGFAMNALEGRITEYEAQYMRKPVLYMSKDTNIFLTEEWTEWGKAGADKGRMDEVLITSIYGCDVARDESLNFGVIGLGQLFGGSDDE